MKSTAYTLCTYTFKNTGPAETRGGQGGRGTMALPDFPRFNVVGVDHTLNPIKVFRRWPPKNFVPSAETEMYLFLIQNAGFFPNGGQLGSHGGLHMMTSPQNYASMPPGSPEHSQGNSTSPPSVGGHPTEANRKRAVRLQKNREAARECRRKKKEYIKCLENRVAVLEVCNLD